MRFYGGRLGPESSTIGVLIKMECLDTDMHTERMLCKGRQAKELKRLPAKHQKLGKKHKTDSCSSPSEGTNLVDTLILDF